MLLLGYRKLESGAEASHSIALRAWIVNCHTGTGEPRR